MTTLLNNTILPDTLAILYLCKYDPSVPSITVTREIQFKSYFECLEAYANTPNPESQMAAGDTRENFLANLAHVHKNMSDKDWLTELNDFL